MSQLVKSLLLAAGIAVTGLAGAASTPAETAGICAANALIIKKTADSLGIIELSQMANTQMLRNANAYGTDPGFKAAANWEGAQVRTRDARLKTADGCVKSGF